MIFAHFFFNCQPSVMEQFMKTFQILQGLGVGPGSATERWPSRKIVRKWPFFWGEKNYLKNIYFVCIYLLVMPKYWGKQIFTHGRFPEVGEKQKACGARKHAWTKKNDRTCSMAFPFPHLDLYDNSWKWRLVSPKYYIYHLQYFVCIYSKYMDNFSVSLKGFSNIT